MPIREIIVTEIEHLAGEHHRKVATLSDDLALLDSGLDSLAIAILVARLEEKLGLDPFSGWDGDEYPVTLGDFIKRYEQAATRAAVDS